MSDTKNNFISNNPKKRDQINCYTTKLIYEKKDCTSGEPIKNMEERQETSAVLKLAIFKTSSRGIASVLKK